VNLTGNTTFNAGTGLVTLGQHRAFNLAIQEAGATITAVNLLGGR